MNKKAQAKAQALSISIVIPVFNDEDHLKICLKAINKQTVQPDEVIVVDNNCNDASMDVARSFGFVKILQEPKQGVVFARNRGFDAVKSDIIGRIDADSVLPKDWCETVLRYFKEHPEVDAVTGPTGYYDLPLKRLMLGITVVLRTALFYIARPKSKKYLFGSNTAFKTEAWHKVRSSTCTDKSVHEDNDLAIHLVQHGFEVAYSNKVQATISARRADMPPRLAFRYAFSEYRAFRLHNMVSIHAWVAGVILLLLYPSIRFLYRAYDQKTGTFSISRAFSHHEMRVSPIE